MRPSLPASALLVAAVLAVGSPPPVALAKGAAKPTKARPAEWTGDDAHPNLLLHDPMEIKAYGYVPSSIEAGKKTSLVVVLHGHGGTATGMLGYGTPVADARSECWLAVEGPRTIDADGKEGHAWDAGDVPAVLACVDAALAKMPVDPKRVVLFGFSAGGWMSLSTYAARPSSFAGVVTNSSPEPPGAGQKGARVVVSLGTKDPNFQVFPQARAAAEKTVIGRIVAMEGLVHNDLPDSSYMADHVGWILDSKAQSEVLRLPAKPSDPSFVPADSPASKGKGGGFRHALAFEAGGRGAPPDAPAKPAAKAAAAALLAEATKKGAEGGGFASVATEKSQDPLSKESGGAVTGAVVSRYGGALWNAMAKLKGGDASPPVESDAGWHVVVRDP
jgi:predicted esterase